MALAAAACTNTVNGLEAPASSVPTTRSTDVFNGLDACQLLDQLNTGQGFNHGENKSARNQCVALKSGFATYALALDSVQGLSEFATTNTGVVETSINGRDAMQANTSASGCAIAIGVGEHARALVIATMVRFEDNQQACPNARSLAERVEPLLPKG
ncbi:hypothetical protein GCM10017786_49000 [Amycolatopsis deserti]|uniref:DUF3558 domain-containing protein n=1 Tax=Amycolatopsis deserti TaxID=185696 RepID=A0ABQ3J9P6_9PSEU|nr:DUF3558 domain-containing protein [Amycolatopsis deserti]GHF09657.1 hypothetical protein GCM10017786_49000 [Amycolatopsis deserti]